MKNYGRNLYQKTNKKAFLELLCKKSEPPRFSNTHLSNFNTLFRVSHARMSIGIFGIRGHFEAVFG